MEGCIDTEGKEFQRLASKYNIATKSLENLMREWADKDDDTLIDDFIEDKLNGKRIEMSDDTIILAEQRRHFNTREFDNRDDALAYYRDVLQFYKREAIGFHPTADGKYKIVVAKPYMPSNPKYKGHMRPIAGNIIKLPNGRELTVKSATLRGVEDQWDVTTTTGFYRLSSKNNGTFYIWGTGEDGKLDMNIHVPVEVKGSVPYYSEYSQPITSKEATEPTPSTINIYAGTGENADLSNFAERPFIVDSSVGVRAFGDFINLFGKDTEFNSVEQALQTAKIAFASDNMSDDEMDSFEKRIKEATPAEARKIGRQIPMSEEALREWNKHKEEVMKMLIKASFEQNPDALKRLLATGDIPLTHIQASDEWKKLFPKVLMEVREELKGKEDYYSALAPLNKNLRKIRSLLETLPKLDNGVFKNIDEAIEFIGSLASYNPRLGQLSNFMKKTRQENKSLSKEEYDAMMSLLVDTRNGMANAIDSIETGTQSSKPTEQEAAQEKIQEIIQKEEEPQMKQEGELTKDEQAFIDNNTSLSKALTILQTSKHMTPTEVKHVADQMANWISDRITEIQNGNKEVIEKYKTELEGLDLSTTSRIDIARAIGPKRLVKDCRESFLKSQETKNVSARKLALITRPENWNALMYLSAPTFMDNERFSIVNGEVVEAENESPDIDNVNEPQSDDEVQEGGKNVQENWQIEARTRDALQKASAIVRNALRQCYLIGKDGKKVESEFGIWERVPVRDATNSILRWTQGVQDIDEMIYALESKEKDNPWISQILERLGDTSGKESDFQSQFFTTFCLRRQTYGVVKAERQKDGSVVYKALPVNTSPALAEATKAIINQYKIGRHPMFTAQGVNESSLNRLKEINTILSGESEDVPSTEEVTELITEAFNLLGFYAPTSVIEALVVSTVDEFSTTSEEDTNTITEISDRLKGIINKLSEHIDDNNYQPFEYDNKEGIYQDIRKFITPITDKLEDTAISSFYEDGKMYQSYTLPSYLTNLLAKFHKGTDEDFKNFIQSQYGSSEFFKSKTGKADTGWLCPWLDKMAREEGARKMFDHKVQLTFDKKAYMTEMSDLQYTLSILTEYFSYRPSTGAITVPAWFRVPMLSNKTSSEYIRFYRYVGADYKDDIAEGMASIMFQELARIRTVKARNLKKGDKGFIKNWDEQGHRFKLVSFLNSYLDGNQTDTKLGKLIAKAITEGITDGERAELTKEAIAAIKDKMQERADAILSSYERDGLFEAAKSIQNIGSSEEEIKDNIEQFIWNDSFAAMNILELTITDPAYYKDAVDLQKRFAQIHAPGIRPNVKARDYGDGTPDSAKPVADKYSRTIVVTDFEKVTSNVIENISIVFERKIKAAKDPVDVDLYTNMRDKILAAFKDINVTDAQAFNCPTSYRKKAILFGRWNKEKQDIYEKLRDGKANFTEIEKAFGEILKPFVYTQTLEHVGVTGSPIQDIPVPFQNKNSEYLLIMADALLRGEDTGKPNYLRAIYDAMEESAKIDPIRGIDTVQFNSAVKSGERDNIDSSKFTSETQAREYILDSIYKLDETGKRTTDYSSTVRLIDWMDYGIQQEVPSHFKEHSQAHGSQIRAITPSELDMNMMYEVEGKSMTAKEFIEEYEKTIAENIEESLDEIMKRFNIKATTRKERNIALAKIIQDELNSSSRYGIDLRQSCLLDENGEFNMPLGDPIQARRIEQLLNSIIKNTVNKQEIAGGPVVQVSSYGTARQLSIRFKDKRDSSGKTLLMTEEEWNKSTNKDKGTSYTQYRSENQGAIAYLECYAPISSNALFQNFADENGNIDIKAIEAVEPELLKMVGYRIPTEDKYSCAPLKIVGFLPREAGEGIMLPYEITTLSGSDFDVDKMYLMIKEFDFIPDKHKIRQALYKELIASQGGKISQELKKAINDLLDQFMANPYDEEHLVTTQVAKGVLPFPKSAYDKLLKAYVREKNNKDNVIIKAPTKGRAYRNNKIVDMTYEVLTHETSVDKILNPGGFEPQKKLGYMVAAKKTHPEMQWNDLDRMSIEELKKLSMSDDQNLAFIDTHVQFYKQNSAAAALIGIFAVAKVAHAFVERDPLYIYFGKATKLTVPLIIGDTELSITQPVKIDPRTDTGHNLIGKVLGSLVAASADAAKDPVLNLMNINKDTANILNTAIRLGIPFEDAALLLSQKCVEDLLSELDKKRLKGEAISLEGIVSERLNKLKTDASMTAEGSTDKLMSQGLSKDDLITGLTETSMNHEIKALTYIKALLTVNKELKGITLATRFNSISNAVGPLIVDNLMMEKKMAEFSPYIAIYHEDTQDYSSVENIYEVLSLHPILDKFREGYRLASTILRDMPLYGFNFTQVMATLPVVKAANIIADRETFSKFADFYCSYLLVMNEVIDPDECSYYINDFPKEFFYDKKYKEKYIGNPFIDAMKLNIDSKTGLATIKVDITGLDTEQKDILTSGFTDLLLKDKELAIKLFKYSFFIGGLGFTPKSFMSLTPIFVKQAIDGYKESFTKTATVDPVDVIALFVRNNWKDSKIVKYLPESRKVIRDGVETTINNFTVSVTGERTYLTLTDKNLYSRYADQGYIRTKIGNEEKLFVMTYSNDKSHTINYVEIKPLGSNGAYLEFTDTPINVKDNVTPSEEDTLSEGSNDNGVRPSESEEPAHREISYEGLAQKAFEVYYTSSGKTTEEAKELAGGKVALFKTKSKTEQQAAMEKTKKFISTQLAKAGIKVNENELNEIFKSLC